MGIKFDSESKTYTVSFHKRHPITRKPVSRSRKGIKTERMAKRVLAELTVQVEDHLKKQVVPSWPEFLEQYIAKIDRENELSKGTVYKREKVLKKHTLPDWYKKRVDQVSGQDIRDLIHDKFANNAESHKKFMIKGIRAVMQYALDLNLIQRDPTPKIKFKQFEKIKTVLNEEQILLLLQKAQQMDWEWYPHYAVALYTGLRSGELYALRWENIDLKERKLLVKTSWSSKDGFKSTKSGNDRVVEIPSPLLPTLRDLKLKSSDESDFVLPRLLKWDQGEQARDLRLFLKSIDLPEVRFHDLRASWATLLLSKGVAPSKVMSMGGWANMKTMLIYMRMAGIDIRGATSCLDHMEFHGISEAKVLDFKPM